MAFKMKAARHENSPMKKNFPSVFKTGNEEKLAGDGGTSTHSDRETDEERAKRGLGLNKWQLLDEANEAERMLKKEKEQKAKEKKEQG